MQIDELIKAVFSYTGSLEVEPVLTEAFQIAQAAHHDLQRINGDTYINHPLAVAGFLADWHAPLPVVATGLLHDVHSPDYSHGCDLEDIQSCLGSDIRRLVEAITALNGSMRQIERNFDAEVDVINIQHHMTAVLQQEPEVVVIKIADRLHNLQTISVLDRYFQDRGARIGFNLLAPLADRLGMGNVKRLLEDYSFGIIDPTQYQTLRQRLADARLQEEVQQLLAELEQALCKQIFRCEVQWQLTSLYTLYRHQVEQNARQGRAIRVEATPLRIVDAGSFIILTETEEECYRMLGLVHKFYQPVKGQFRDFIGDQKENGYQSLHTQVKHTSGNLLNIVIRTQTMHLIAQRGITARWWGIPLELLPRLPHESKPVDKEIQVFAADGRIKYLPQGATVLDFSYSIHTDMGNNCAGALVNGEHVDIYRVLQNGDRIEVITGTADTVPQLEWLDHVRTPSATGAIRQWLIQHQRKAMVERGRALLKQELQPLGLNMAHAQVAQLLPQVASKENLDDVEDLLAVLGVGKLYAYKVVEQLKSRGVTAVHSSSYTEPVNSIRVLSSDEALLPFMLAKCCRPVPFDDIVAYRRTDDKLLVHKRNCPRSRAPEKTIVVEWDTEPAAPNYIVHVEALNRPGLANDLTAMVSQFSIDMPRFSAAKRADGLMAEAYIYLGKTTSTQRSRIQKALEAVPSVTHVEVMHSSFASLTLPSPTETVFRSNPYGPGIAKGTRFYGRETESLRILTYLCDPMQNNAIVLWGQKRIGKTSLVIHLQEQARGRFLPVYIDMEGLKDGSTSQFLYQLMHRISHVLNEQTSLREINVPALNKLRKDPLGYFDTFMDVVGKVNSPYPLVVILDEFPCLNNLREEGASLSAIFSRLRSQTQHGQGIHLLLSGGGLLSQLLDQSGIASLFPITFDEKLGALEAKAAHHLIKSGLSKAGNISDNAIDLLLRLTSGHPYYLQLLCSYLYEQTQGNKIMITTDFVSHHINEWIAQADRSRFQHLWEGNNLDGARKNKLILSAIADLRGKNDEIEYRQLVEVLHSVITEQQLIQTLEDLSDLGILRHNHSTYAIEAKLFARWLRQHWPLHLTLKEGGWL